MEKLQFKITKLDANQRIDKYIKKVLSDAPVSLIYKLIRLNDIKVNNKKTISDYIIQESDVISIFLTTTQVQEFITDYEFSYIKYDFEIVFEDNNILVINKKRGLLVHGDINEGRYTLANQVLSYLKDKKEFNPANRGYVPSPINRLDKETTGIVLFGKNQITNQIVSQILSENNLARNYLALVHGKIVDDGMISAKLSKNKFKRGLVSASEDGKEALTKYKLLKQIGGKSLVRVNLLTGRSNQIRVHFKSVGHPLVGDKKYNKNERENILCLHCQSIEFYNIDGELSYLSNKVFEAPLAKDMEDYINRLQ